MWQRRRWIVLGTAGVALAVVVVALALFQPWKLWVDDEVSQAAPAGAVPITAPATETAPDTVAPDTVAPPTEAPAPSTSASSPTLPSPATSTVAPPAAAPPSTVPPPPTVASAPTTVALPLPLPPLPPPPTVAPVPVGGSLVGIDHATGGTVLLLQDAAGTQFVRIENLDTSNGPDLFVYLSTNPPDGPEGQFDDDFVNLGRLQGNIGSANYVVPPGTDLTRFASVVIWCDRFDSAFGAAPLT